MTLPKAYQSIWQDTGSPLLFNIKELAKTIQEKCNANADTKNFKLVLGMRYGAPSLKSALNELRDAGESSVIAGHLSNIRLLPISEY